MAKRHYIPITADVDGVNDSQRAFIRKVIRTALAGIGVDLADHLVFVDGDMVSLNQSQQGGKRPVYQLL